MNLNWQQIGLVASGGTILDIARGFDGSLWTATSTGLLRKQADRWLPVSRGMSLTQATAILSVRKTIVTAGWPDGILYSTNNGSTWHKAWIDQIDTFINCLEISPNYAKDRVLLAGTQGKGILRTTDGGRHWQLSNFGLRGFSVYGLSAVGIPKSFRDRSYLKEIVFAGTDDGVYQSPNGGRAWRPAGNETSGQTILAITLSHDFPNDQTIFAGTESGNLFRSKNGGQAWETLDLSLFSPGAVNCLLATKNGDLFAGTSQAGILRSIDRGETWEPILSDVPPVLMLKQIDDQLLAGFPDDGLLISWDAGLTWKSDLDLAAKRFQWLVSPANNEFVAAGPEEGIWISSDQGETWKASPNWPKEKLVLGISAENGVILVASPDGIWHSIDHGENWSLGLKKQLNLSPFYLVQFDKLSWGAGDRGQLWFSQDQGQTWDSVESDFSGNPVIGLAISPNFSSDQTLVVGIRNTSLQQVQIWRSIDGEKNWSLWHSLEDEDSPLKIATQGEFGSKSIFGWNTKVIKKESDGWNVDIITSDDAPITTIMAIPNSDMKIAALVDQVLRWSGDMEWQLLGSSIQGESVIDFHLMAKNESDHTLFTLTQDGMIWRCEI